MGEDPLVPGYRPLHRTLFGGPDGSDLRSLTGISVTLFDNQPFSMKFFYNNERISRERLELGYHPSKVFWRTIIFPVDGPGGEIIEVVDVAVQYYADESLIVTLDRGYHDINKVCQRCGSSETYIFNAEFCFQISTNRSRCCWFRDTKISGSEEEEASLKRLEIVPRTTLIWFYAAKVSLHYCFLCCLCGHSRLTGENSITSMVLSVLVSYRLRFRVRNP